MLNEKLIEKSKNIAHFLTGEWRYHHINSIESNEYIINSGKYKKIYIKPYKKIFSCSLYIMGTNPSNLNNNIFVTSICFDFVKKSAKCIAKDIQNRLLNFIDIETRIAKNLNFIEKQNSLRNEEQLIANCLSHYGTVTKLNSQNRYRLDVGDQRLEVYRNCDNSFRLKFIGNPDLIIQFAALLKNNKD